MISAARERCLPNRVHCDGELRGYIAARVEKVGLPGAAALCDEIQIRERAPDSDDERFNLCWGGECGGDSSPPHC
jgi:hypothetical protein